MSLKPESTLPPIPDDVAEVLRLFTGVPGKRVLEEYIDSLRSQIEHWERTAKRHALALDTIDRAKRAGAPGPSAIANNESIVALRDRNRAAGKVSGASEIEALRLKHRPYHRK